MIDYEMYFGMIESFLFMANRFIQLVHFQSIVPKKTCKCFDAFTIHDVTDLQRNKVEFSSSLFRYLFTQKSVIRTKTMLRYAKEKFTTNNKKASQNTFSG